MAENSMHDLSGFFELFIMHGLCITLVTSLKQMANKLMNHESNKQSLANIVSRHLQFKHAYSTYGRECACFCVGLRCPNSIRIKNT